MGKPQGTSAVLYDSLKGFDENMLTKLKYLSDIPLLEFEQPYELFGHPTLDSGKITNCEYSIVDDVQIQDIRKGKLHCGLDTTGFTFLKHTSSCFMSADDFESAGNDLDNERVVKYLEETMGLVKHELCATKVICFDWRVSDLWDVAVLY